jgi:hypothetical protein
MELTLLGFARLERGSAALDTSATAMGGTTETLDFPTSKGEFFCHQVNTLIIDSLKILEGCFMFELFFAGALFFLGYFIGNSVGQNAGYVKGWQDKENGNSYKQPK